MAKKEKKVSPRQALTKRQLSKWQRQQKIRRIIIIVAAVFLVGILGYVGYGYYNKEIKPFREVVIEVNDTRFNLGYYVDMLDAYTKGIDSSQLYYMVDLVANQIVQDELVKQGAESLGIGVEAQEIDDWIKENIKENKVPSGKAFRDIAAVTLLREKLIDHFSSGLADTMEQAHIQVMLVEGEGVANDVIARVNDGEDFVALSGNFSCNSQIVGDLGWLPRDLMPNSLIGDAVFTETASPSAPNGTGIMKLYDNSASKSIGYWLIEVTEKDEEKGIKARALLLGSKQEADEVKAELTDENFAELAKEHSQYKGGEDGGELGWLKQGDISDAFDEVAFNLELNVISEPVQDKSVQTSGGYWIVNILEKDKNKPISDEIRKGLANNDFTEWLQTQRTISTINNYLDEEKKALAIEEVSKGR